MTAITNKTLIEKRLLYLILALFLLLGITYALVTPVFEASDELWHYPMVRHLADGNPLPVQVFDPAQAGPWKQEASQPPLYYYLAAALTFWIDTGDMSQIRWLNPHVDNGLITADGNINLAIHDPAGNPWQGTLLAVRLVRLFSVCLGGMTVWLTYLMAQEVLPQRPDVVLAATAVNAFLPMFLFITGSVNNDNLAIPLASAGGVLLIWGGRYLTSQSGKAVYHLPLFRREIPFPVYWLGVGVVMGLAILTKQGTFALLPLAWGTLVVARWRYHWSSLSDDQWRELPPAQFWRTFARILLESFFYLVVVLLPVVLIAGWWYWRNIQLYGDFLGWNAFIAVLGSRAQPASLAQLWGERQGFMMAFWGLFGGVNVPMWGWIYALLNGVLLTAVAGFAIYLWQQFRAVSFARRGRFHLPQLMGQIFALVQQYFALVICLLLATAVIFGLVQWATTTWSSQGRLVFTALSALSTLLVVGLVGWLPPSVGRWVGGGLGLFLFLVAAAAPWLWIRPAYQAERYAPARPLPLQPVLVQFGPALRLTGYGLSDGPVQPGDFVDVILSWEVQQPMSRDWSVFVHLNDPVLGVPMAQRDMYPGQGLRPTSLLRPGEMLTTFYRLTVPETAVSPATLSLTIGLYDFANGERLHTVTGADAVTLAELNLEPAPGEYPNPTSVNFMQEIELVGYEIAPRHLRPGEAVTVTLYVRSLRPLTTDYSFSLQAVNLPDTTRWGNHDLGQPTSTWSPGQIQPVVMTFTLADQTPPAVYPLILVLYHQAGDGSLPKLQLVAGDGRITQSDFLTLTHIRVE